MRAFAVAALGVATVSATNDFGLSKDLQNEISAALTKECGSKCLDFWGDIQTSSPPGEALQSALTREMADKHQKFGELQNALESSSFLQASPLELPCFDDKSCAAAEAVANSCQYGRMASMSVYQGLNIAVHTFGIVTKLVCACVDVLTVSKCLLRKASPWPCEPIAKVYEGLLSTSGTAWAAVKAQTSTCKVVGDIRAQIA